MIQAVPLAAIRIVLVEPSHPGNIGAVARAMKNMGVVDLVLVKPREFPHPDATARASGADDVLANARVVETLPQAIADCGLVLAAIAGADAQDPTAARRRFHWSPELPRPRRFRLAVVRGFEEAGQPAVRANFEAALKVLATFCDLAEPVAMPDLPYGPAVGTIIDSEGASSFRAPASSARSSSSTLLIAAPPDPPCYPAQPSYPAQPCRLAQPRPAAATCRPATPCAPALYR